jgi:hypothetical protein
MSFALGEHEIRLETILSVAESIISGPEKIVSVAESIFSGRETILFAAEKMTLGRSR